MCIQTVANYTVCFHTHSQTQQEAKRKLLRIQNTKLGPVLIGMGRDGVVRADCKTKEVIRSLILSFFLFVDST